jgi:hypothetical protein
MSLISMHSDGSRRRKRPPQRVDGRTRPAKETKRLIAEYSAQLGAAAADPLVRFDIVRLAETEVVIADRRAAVLRRELVDLAAVVRLQNIAIRLRRALRLDVRKPEPADEMTIARYAALQAAGKAKDS